MWFLWYSRSFFLTRQISGLTEVVLLGRHGGGVRSVQPAVALQLCCCVVLWLWKSREKLIVVAFFSKLRWKHIFYMKTRSSNRQLGPSGALSFRELMVGFLEMETPASASSPSSQLSTDLKDVWPHRRRPVLTPATLFSAPEGAARVGFKMNIQSRKKKLCKPQKKVPFWHVEAVPEWYLQPASSSGACFSPGWEVPAAPLSAWWNTLLVLCLAPCCPEVGGSAEGAGGEAGCGSAALPESCLARRTLGPSYRGTEALSLQPPRTSLPEPCAALSTWEEHRAPGRRGSMDTAEPGTQTVQTKVQISNYVFLVHAQAQI